MDLTVTPGSEAGLEGAEESHEMRRLLGDLLGAQNMQVFPVGHADQSIHDS